MMKQQTNLKFAIENQTAFFSDRNDDKWRGQICLGLLSDVFIVRAGPASSKRSSRNAELRELGKELWENSKKFQSFCLADEHVCDNLSLSDEKGRQNFLLKSSNNSNTSNQMPISDSALKKRNEKALSAAKPLLS